MKSGYLQVSKLHQIYFETKGNRNGIPVLVVHGGPGGGSNTKDFHFFDPNKYFAILYDQRGAGKSLPSGELNENNTNELVDDIALLLDFLGVKKTVLFGGSWGSCLSLLFAIRYPKQVAGIVLRGSFLGTLKNRVHFENGGNQQQFPEPWKRFLSLVPVEERENAFDYYLTQLLESNIEQQKIYAYELERYGIIHSMVGITPELATKRLANFDGVNNLRIFAHYSKNNFFIPDEFILNHAEKIPSCLLYTSDAADE